MAKQARPRAMDFLSESESVPSQLARSTATRPQEAHEDEDTEGSSDRDNEEIDAPGVAQWIDDENFDLQEPMDDASPSLAFEAVGSEDDDERSTSETGSLRRLRSLENDLSTLPLGTLRSAQRSLARVRALSNTESESKGDFSESDDDDPSARPATGKAMGQPSKPKSDLTKRTNKHAPVEVTSKRPVSRRRVVVDDQLPKSRDPRFMHATGRYDALKFKQQYDFLSGLRSDELSTLRTHVKRARKLLTNSPSHLRAEREEEVMRLERAMKRAESAVNLDNREHVELKALHTAKRVEEGKRKQGKMSWWMKRSEKKAFLERARLDAVASIGGKQAVKKALEKKQKKIGQKEKKMRPFKIERLNGKKRCPVGSVDSEARVKRRKIV